MMVSLSMEDAEPAVTSVLGLRSEDKNAGERLTASLRTAFAERDMSGGQDLTLEEVILTLDCSSEEDTACMTEAGGALETEKLVYGSLQESGGSYVVEISVLDVTTGQIEAQGSLPFDSEALGADNVDATAVEIVNSLYPQADAAVPAATPIDEGTTDDGDPDNGRGADDGSGFVWGPYKPRPAWKKAALGISATVLIAGLLTGAIGGGLSTFRYKDDFEAARKASEDDDISSNDVRPTTNQEEVDWLLEAGKNPNEACDVATLPALLRNPNERNADAVVNAEVAIACGNGKTAARIGTIGWIGAGVGAAATIAFSIIYFVHKDKGPGANARRPSKRRFRLTGGPTQGGAMVGGMGRF